MINRGMILYRMQSNDNATPYRLPYNTSYNTPYRATLYRTLVNLTVSLPLILAILLLAGCNTSQPPTTTMTEIEGTSVKRVTTITAMLAQFHPLPTPLLDAQFVEEKIGDGELGPADYRAYMQLEVGPEAIAAWQAILTPLDTKPDYPTLPQTFTWWVIEANFDSLQFYAPDPLTSRSNGWVAIDPQSGKIYIYTFTT